ncbi:MAG: T9SS type A sorting domain-containing protein [Bacteroidota bacterium]
MKKLILLLLISFLSIRTIGQPITCSNFTITDFGPNPWDSTQYVIGIQFNGGPFDQINYPYIQAVIDSSGDTVATGGLFFFGQLGGTIQDYPVTPTGNMNLTQFTAVFSYGNVSGTDDTCMLSYPATISAVHESVPKEEVLSVWPNPASEKINLHTNSSSLGAEYTIYGSSGKKVKAGTLQTENEEIDLTGLTSGMYQLVVGEDRSATIRFMKNR